VSGEPRAGRVLLAPSPDSRARLVAWAAAVCLPLAGFVLLLAAPGADVTWEHHPSHFWLVLATSVVSAALAVATSEIAQRRADARLLLVSFAFLAAAGFLGLHALATPGVLLDAPNQGFVIATPVGLLIASLLVAASALPLPPERARLVVERAGLLRGGLLVLMAIWAALSLGSVGPLDDASPAERASGTLVLPALAAVLLYTFAGWRYLRMALRSGSAILLSVAGACVLLAEAMLAVAYARSWQLTWWEWHLLMLAAFGAIAYSARREEREERFSDLYLDHTAAGTREVSVLFADLAGFTRFSEGRDPHEVTDMLNTYFEVAVPPIVREEDGQIDRLIGDAIMATWGTRGDQPDHAERAVRAAAALQAETSRIADEHPDWPRFRVAINSGEALVGVVGAESGKSYTVIGDTVNVAARLEGRAPPGEVVVADATLRAVPGLRATSLGAVEVKGKRDPVDAYLLETRLP
jgi:adenylate cyclase